MKKLILTDFIFNYNNVFMTPVFKFLISSKGILTLYNRAMSKTLSSTNRYLKKPNASERLVKNVSSSTAIETGKSANVYETRASSVKSYQR